METPKKSDLITQRKIRLEKVEALRELGVNPYPSKSYKQFLNKEITDKYNEFEGKEVILAGRIIAWREHGELIFGDILDESGKIQIMIRKKELREDLKRGYLGVKHLALLDLADFVEVKGMVGKSKTGEVSLMVKNIRLLAKALRPIPRELKNKEQQFRRRYLDLVVHPEKKEIFKRKAQFWQIQREFMKNKGFMEVEVPIMETVTGGADARPFITHHNALDQDFYLRISTELYQKRLLGAGFEKIYTLGPNFRNEGIDDEHLQEYYDLEWYWAYANYKDNMSLVKELFLEIADKIYKKTKFETRGYVFDLASKWEELDYVEAMKTKFNIDVFNSSDEEILQIVRNNNIELSGSLSRARLVDNLWKILRSQIPGPVFIVNHPKFVSPLAKSRDDNEEITERFQVIIAGSELGNGYSEINDPIDQLERFLKQQDMRNSGDEEAQMLDIDFVEMLEYGMPPASGYGQSERVFWFLENITGREGTFFPQMKTEIDNITKRIYKGKIDFPTDSKDE